MRFIIIVLFLVELIVLCKIYDIAKQLLSPASIFSIFFLSIMIISLFFGDAVYSGEEYSYNGYLWIQFAIMAVNIGHFLSAFIKVKKVKLEKKYRIKKNNVKSFVVFVGAFLVIIALYNYFNAGGVKNTAQYAYDYYTGSLPTESMALQLFNQLLSILMLLASFFGGVYLGYERKVKKKLIAFLPLLYEIIGLLYSSQKLGVVLSIMLMVIGYIIFQLYSNKNFSLKTLWKIFKKYWLLIPVAFALLVMSFMLRFGVFNQYYFLESVRKVGIYAFGSPHAFNCWFSTNQSVDYTMGAQTFTGIPHALGLLKRETGVYLDMVYTDFGATNVYMSFRGLIDDYGKIGSLIFMFIFGFVAGYGYKSFRIRKSSISLFIVVMSYLFIFFSLFGSPFVYLNLSVFFVLYLFVRMVFNMTLRKVNSVKKYEVIDFKQIR